MHGDVGTPLWIICYFTVVLGLAVYGVHRYFIVYLFFRNKDRGPVAPDHFAELPIVTIQLPIFNEIYVIERLLSAVARIDYPKHRLEIQVLDDSTDETSELTKRKVEELRKQGFDASVLHRTKRTGFKAGALDAGLGKAKGEFFFILDADFVPNPEILRTTIHHFTDSGVGMIQTRWGHLNRGFSWLTRAQAILLDGHLVLEQTARSRTGRFFNFNGTAGLWRKECIVQAGGWQHDTLTEDLDLSYRAQLKGWKFVFLSDIVTPAELPADMDSFKSQQHRWTKGSIQTCKKVLPKIWQSQLPLFIKIEATAHLTSNFAYLLLALLCVLLQHPSGNHGSFGGWFRVAFVDAPIFVATTFSVGVFYMCAQRELYPRTWMRDICFFPFVLSLGIGISINNARAVLEALFNQESEFKRTPKYGINRSNLSRTGSRYAPVKTLLPLIELIFAGYFSFFLIRAFQRYDFLSLPFLMLFQVGFTYVALSSFWQRLPKFTESPRNISIA
jgi:cellulose synthase/poly-beta-1,6-N-acetylglucosamine synthase-like glycosyltransferase